CLVVRRTGNGYRHGHCTFLHRRRPERLPLSRIGQGARRGRPAIRNRTSNRALSGCRHGGAFPDLDRTWVTFGLDAQVVLRRRWWRWWRRRRWGRRRVHPHAGVVPDANLIVDVVAELIGTKAQIAFLGREIPAGRAANEEAVVRLQGQSDGRARQVLDV